MRDIQHRTIEDRIEEIEHEVHEIKSLLLRLSIPKAFAAEKLMDEFMNVKELASFAKVETSSIYSACARHELKFIKIGKLYKFKKEDVMTWLNASVSKDDVNVDEYVDNYLQKHVLKG
jgi:excisionase family DNA binding protein